MSDRDAATTLAIAYLRERGYIVTEDPRFAWVTPKQLAEQVGFKGSPHALWRRLHHPACPPYDKRQGPTGRITQILATSDLVAWVARECTPGVAAKPLHAAA